MGLFCRDPQSKRSCHQPFSSGLFADALFFACGLQQLPSLKMSEFPTIKSTKSLVAKHVTKEKWEKLGELKTETTGFTLAKAIACAIEFDDQHCGIYAGDKDSYEMFKDVFDPIITEYHGLPADFSHTSDMDVSKIEGNINEKAPVHSTRIRVGRSIDGFGLSPGITKQQRLDVESLMKKAFANLTGDLAGTYYPLTGMSEKVRQQLVDDHFLFMSGDPNLKVAGMERDWPEGRGIFHNKDKTFLTWVNEEDQLRIISMQKGGDLGQVYRRLVDGASSVEKQNVPFSHHDRLGFLTFCPTNLGTTIRASVHIKVPKLAADYSKLEAVAGKYNLQVRGTTGEHTEAVGGVYDISNKRRMGLTEYQAVKEMQDGILELIKLEKEA